MTWQSSASPSTRFTKRALARSSAATASYSFFFSSKRWTVAGLFAWEAKACAWEARFGATDWRIWDSVVDDRKVQWSRGDNAIDANTYNICFILNAGQRVLVVVMPVTRSSSRHNSQQPSIVPYATRHAAPSGNRDTKEPSKPSSNEIIILSSDDDEPPSKGTLPSRKTSNRTLRKNAASSAPILLSDVLEISSDEESHSKKPSARKEAHPSETTNKDLRRTIKKLQEVCLVPFHLCMSLLMAPF